MDHYKKQIFFSGIAKVFSILSSLLIVPLTINFVNSDRYGIWLTISSIVSWLSYFDFGLGNGFRNKFAESKAYGNIKLAQQYVSTTYFALICIVSVVCIIALLINGIIDWPKFLRVDSSYFSELRLVFGIVCFFFCVNMVVNLFSTLLTADQKPGYSALLLSFGQIASLISIWILTKICTGSLTKLALYFSGVPCLVLLVSSIIAFCFTPYRKYKPSIHDVNRKLIPDVLTLGLRFFLISLCLLVIFQMINIVISRELGPQSVAEYNVAYKYFNVLFSVALVIITPFWSAFTDAYTKKDFAWMKIVCKKLERLFLLSVLFAIIMLVCSNTVYGIWLGKSLSINKLTSISIMIYVISQIIGNIYMYLINGVGAVRIQLLIYLFFTVVAWPIMTLLCRKYGIAGVIVIPSLTCFTQAVFGYVQIHKIINGKANGWWNK